MGRVYDGSVRELLFAIHGRVYVDGVDDGPVKPRAAASAPQAD